MTLRAGLISAIVLALATVVPAGAPAFAGTLLEKGKASWYRAHRGPTASGIRHDAAAMSAAHPSLPFGSRILVTNLRNGRSVVVAITDRGPFTGNRILDVSEAAARELGFHRAGIATVRIERAARG
jgi:rare lipoprotein A